jgi:hypothetical protein
MVAYVEEAGTVDERDEDSGSESESEDESSSSGSEGEDSSSESDSEDEGESPQEFLDRIGAQDHYDNITSQINPSDDPSLLNEDNKHYYTARALGVRRGMREGTMDGDEPFDTLSGVVGGQLDDIGVRVPNYSTDTQYGEGEGATQHNDDGTSTIALSTDDFAGPELGREAVSALYHESVHAEQWSLASDVLDGTNTNPNDRESRLGEEFDLANDSMRGQIQGEAGDDYRRLPTEQEAYQADGDVGAMYERVGAMHDELEARTAGTRERLDAEAEERGMEWQENPLYEPQGGWQNNPLYQQPEGAQ